MGKHFILMGSSGALKLAIAVGFLSAIYFGKDHMNKKAIDDLMKYAETVDRTTGIMICGAVLFVGTIIGAPSSPVEFFLGYNYGMGLGFLIVVAFKQGAGVVAYWLGRTLFRDFVRQNIVPKFKVLQALDGAFEGENGFKMALAFRSMYIPVFVKNYGCAALGCSFWDASRASLVFGPLYGLTNLYAGSVAKEMMTVAGGDKSADWAKTAMSVVTGALCVGSGIYATKLMKKQLAEVTKEIESKAGTKKD